jgi:hypothetical protein
MFAFLSAVASKTTFLAHRDAVWGGRQPPHLQEPFFVGIFSMTMADDAFYGGLVCIVSAKI